MLDGGRATQSGPSRPPDVADAASKIGRGTVNLPKGPNPPLSRPSIFHGTGVFTANDPRAAIGLKADWVALQLDAEGGHTASIQDLRGAGYRHVGGWQARADQAGATYANDNLDFYIGQAEAEDQLQACLGLNVTVPKALVGKPDDWTPRVLPVPGWELVCEWYQVDDPSLTFERISKQGWPVTNYLIGVYHGYELQTALAQFPIGSWPPWSVYIAETMTAEDRKLLS